MEDKTQSNVNLDDRDDQDTPETRPADGTGERASGVATEGDDGDLRKQRDEYYDRLLRKTAEFDNYRKRLERERRELADFAATELLTELLPLVDDLDRALRVEVSGEGAEPYRAGVEIIYKQLLELLRKRNVTPIEAVGKPFDPHFHQAVVQEVRPDLPEGEVVAEFRRGYMLGDRLLRPAMVKVAKA